MNKRVYETIIIGAGIAGLACARKLHENNKDFLVISEDIGGRILTSEDGGANYGAVLIFNNYKNVKKFTKKKMKFHYLTNVSFQKGHENFRLYPRIFFANPLGCLNFTFLILKFQRHYEAFKKRCEHVSQAEALRSDPFLFTLYNQNAMEVIHQYNIEDISKDFEGMARSCAFLPFKKINAFTFLWGVLSLIVSFYEVSFLIDEMIREFKTNIVIDKVIEIKKKEGFYRLKTKNKTIDGKNIVVATPPHVSKKLLNLKEIKDPVNAHVFHLSGKLRKPWNRDLLTMFSGTEPTLGILRQEDGTITFYSEEDKPDFTKYFYEFKIITHKFWEPAYNMVGSTLWECEQGENLYLIGDHNIHFLEDAYISGLYAANRIIAGGR